MTAAEVTTIPSDPDGIVCAGDRLVDLRGEPRGQTPGRSWRGAVLAGAFGTEAVHLLGLDCTCAWQQPDHGTSSTSVTEELPRPGTGRRAGAKMVVGLARDAGGVWSYRP
jgi:hypothetical protein